MTYNYIIVEKETNQEIYTDYTTSQTKKRAVENALEHLEIYGRASHYAIITSFDWQRGNRRIGVIR